MISADQRLTPGIFGAFIVPAVRWSSRLRTLHTTFDKIVVCFLSTTNSLVHLFVPCKTACEHIRLRCRAPVHFAPPPNRYMLLCTLTFDCFHPVSLWQTSFLLSTGTKCDDFYILPGIHGLSRLPSRSPRLSHGRPFVSMLLPRLLGTLCQGGVEV